MIKIKSQKFKYENQFKQINLKQMFKSWFGPKEKIPVIKRKLVRRLEIFWKDKHFSGRNKSFQGMEVRKGEVLLYKKTFWRIMKKQLK